MAEHIENSMETELEVLKEIYISELTYTRKDDGTLEKLELLLHPATGHDTTKQYVCMTVIFTPSAEYPFEPPAIEIRNPRGLGEEEVRSLEEDMKVKAKQCVGEVMLYELIEMAKDSLTEGNIPHCPCVVCLEHFHEHDSFHRTACYHYFHKHCLQNYLKHTRDQIEEEKREAEELRHHDKSSIDQLKAIICPVCRADLDEESLAVEHEEKEEMAEEKEEEFHLPPELKEQQRKMREMYLRQKAKGGIIDLEQEKNKFLVNPEDRLPIRSLTPTAQETSSTLTSATREGDRNSDSTSKISSKSPRKFDNRDAYDERGVRGGKRDGGHERRGGRGSRGRGYYGEGSNGNYRNRQNRTKGEEGHRQYEGRSSRTDSSEKANSQRESDARSAEKLSEKCEADLVDGERSGSGRGGFNRNGRGGRGGRGQRRGGGDRGQRGRDRDPPDSHSKGARDSNHRSGRAHAYQDREGDNDFVEDHLSDKTQGNQNSGRNSEDTLRHSGGKGQTCSGLGERGGRTYGGRDRRDEDEGHWREGRTYSGRDRRDEDEGHLRGGRTYSGRDRRDEDEGHWRGGRTYSGRDRWDEDKGHLRGGRTYRGGRGRRDEDKGHWRGDQERNKTSEFDDRHSGKNTKEKEVGHDDRKKPIPVEKDARSSEGPASHCDNNSDGKDRTEDDGETTVGARAAWRGTSYKNNYIEKKTTDGCDEDRDRNRRSDSGRKDWKDGDDGNGRQGQYGKSHGRYEKPRRQQQGYQQQHQQRYQGNRQNERRERRDRPNDRRDGQNDRRDEYYRRAGNEHHQGERDQTRVGTTSATDACVEKDSQDDEKTDLKGLKGKGWHRNGKVGDFVGNYNVEFTLPKPGCFLGQKPSTLYGLDFPYHHEGYGHKENGDRQTYVSQNKQIAGRWKNEEFWGSDYNTGDLETYYPGYSQPLEDENWEEEIDPYAYERRLVKPEDRSAYDEIRKTDCEYYKRKVEERVERTRMVEEEERRIKREELMKQPGRENEPRATKCESITSGKSLVQLFHEKQMAKKLEEEKTKALKEQGHGGDLSDNEPPSPDSGFDGSVGSLTRSFLEGNVDGTEQSKTKTSQLSGSSEVKDIVWVGVKKKEEPALNYKQPNCDIEKEEDAFTDAWKRRNELEAKKRERQVSDRKKQGQEADTGAGRHSVENTKYSVTPHPRYKENEVSGFSQANQDSSQAQQASIQRETKPTSFKKPLVKAPPLKFSKKNKAKNASVLAQPPTELQDSIALCASAKDNNHNASNTKEKPSSKNFHKSFNSQSGQNICHSSQSGLNTVDDGSSVSLEETIRSVYKSAKSLLHSSSES